MIEITYLTPWGETFTDEVTADFGATYAQHLADNGRRRITVRL